MSDGVQHQNFLRSVGYSLEILVSYMSQVISCGSRPHPAVARLRVVYANHCYSYWRRYEKNFLMCGKIATISSKQWVVQMHKR
ncbi:hypothetical protein TNCT_337651 [Trichonephila clavata]|uniref:Uncharacterized protein n=1 Tax=Trichonephila clavata TaxID=2740835 RepID=A0A8X6HSW3_TRICU|nr:hypothetical protein TNCT_337651 [Trichonephila clavata]